LDLEVEILNVSKRFGNIEAVRNVSFSVGKNEFFSLLGPSGCGKTTILRIIAGLEEDFEGTLKLRGVVANNVPAHKRSVGLVFQGTAVFPHMNVFDNIAFGLKMRKVGRDEIEGRVNRVLKLVELDPEIFGRKAVNKLSGGERQRVEIARALVYEPPVLLLDEPLGPLDLKIRQRMQIELKRIQKRVGTTFIYVTHDQGEALTMSQRVAVMHKGEIQQVGSPNEIYERPSNTFVAQFIGETNLIEGACSATGLFEATKVPNLHAIDVTGCAIEDPRGKKVALMIRPEKISVGKELENLDLLLDGIVQDIIYQGSIAIVVLGLTDEMTIKAQVQPGSKLSGVNAGDKVDVGWNISDACVLPL